MFLNCLRVSPKRARTGPDNLPKKMLRAAWIGGNRNIRIFLLSNSAKERIVECSYPGPAKQALFSIQISSHLLGTAPCLQPTYPGRSSLTQRREITIIQIRGTISERVVPNQHSCSSHLLLRRLRCLSFLLVLLI